jgi:acyl-CoA thioesterase
MSRDLDKNSIVEKMYVNDAFSQWLGIERLEESKGFCKIRMTVREEMLNGFYVAHGGITYSLSDSAFAFASNSQGRHAVSIETSISHVSPVFAGDILTAEAKEDKIGKRIAWYSVTITNQNGELVSIFKGTVYRKSQEWEV